MEAEERPTKVPKLDRGQEDLDDTSDRSPTQGSTRIQDLNKQDEVEISVKDESTIASDAVSRPKKAVSNPTGLSLDADGNPLSKSAAKKLRKQKEWEESRPQRKALRREKEREKRQLRKEAEARGEGTEPRPKKVPAKNLSSTQVPVTFILDCSFDELMSDKERTSLGSQLTRCYGENNRASYRMHMVVSSFGGKLEERFEQILDSHHKLWKNTQFMSGDFVESARTADVTMRQEGGGTVSGSLKMAGSRPDTTQSKERTEEGETQIVYLTSESPNTLEALEPYHTYVIGGLVDRNRHKGVCYDRAISRGIKTAKLPIGEHLKMNSRYVLTTNHVVEIMLKWLELGDWGKSFVEVLPKRKGGVLKSTSADAEISDEETKKDSPGSADQEVQKMKEAEEVVSPGDTNA